MANANTTIRARINADIKQQATAALDAMGLSMSDAIRLLMIRIAEEKKLPFDVKVPNVVTKKAIVELEAGMGRKAVNLNDLMTDLHADD